MGSFSWALIETQSNIRWIFFEFFQQFLLTCNRKKEKKKKQVHSFASVWLVLLDNIQNVFKINAFKYLKNVIYFQFLKIKIRIVPHYPAQTICWQSSSILMYFLDKKDFRLLFCLGCVKLVQTYKWEKPIKNLLGWMQWSQSALVPKDNKWLPGVLFTSFSQILYLALGHCSMFHCYTPWKRKKARGFLTFSRGKEREHWREMG